jgi:hypothetical protein
MHKPIDRINSVPRRASRLIAGTFVLCFAGLLGGCSSLSTPAWDPTDMLDFLDTKKKAPGERKPVFPEGVPGISQGVPKELVRGSPESRASVEAQSAAAAPPVETQPAPPPAKRSRTAAKRSPQGEPAQVEIAPDDVNVDEAPPPPRRQAQRPQRAQQPQAEQQANPFPAPLPR